MIKKKIGIAAGAGVIAITVISVICFASDNSEKEESIVKETTVERGNLTTGVTETGSVQVGTLTQDYELNLVSVSLSGSASSSAGTSGTSGTSTGGAASSEQTVPNGGSGTNSGNAISSSTNSGSANSTINGSAGTQSTSGLDSGSSGTSTASAEINELVVEETYLAVGQQVEAGSPILKLTEESVVSVRQRLEDAVNRAELAFKNAEIQDKQSELEAEGEYENNKAAGSVAKSVYQASIASIDNNIASLQSQMNSASDSSQAASLQSQLEQAQSEAKTKKLEARQLYDETLMKYENADEIYEIAKAEIGDTQKEAQEVLEEANENLAVFETLVNEGTVLADYSGTVLSAPYAKGDILSSSNVLAEYSDPSIITISVSVTQDDITVANIGSEVTVGFAAFEDETYRGTVSAVDAAAATSSTVSYPVTITLTTAPEKILTGMTSDVTFVSKEVEDVLYVSNKAIITENAKSYVKKKNEDSTTAKVEVVTGFSDGSHVEIQEGLSEGDTVFIESKVES